MTEREANRGECSQPCRYKYYVKTLIEEKRPSQNWDIEEDNHGTYIMNSKDLCLINHLDDLINCGVTSFKIEGRMKSDYYVAAAVNTYRRTLNEENFDFIKEIDKIPHRPWTSGFFIEQENHLFIDNPNPVSTHEVSAMCLGGNKILQRNVFNIGDELELLSPGKNFNLIFSVISIKDEKGQSVERANKASEIYYIELECLTQKFSALDLEPDEFLRKKIN